MCVTVSAGKHTGIDMRCPTAMNISPSFLGNVKGSMAQQRGHTCASLEERKEKERERENWKEKSSVVIINAYLKMFMKIKI